MKAIHHLAIALFFFALLAFEVIVFTDIIREPYMVGLCLFLSCIGGWNLGRATVKSLKELKK